MSARPYAYIRRSSRSRQDPGDVSREFQTETVRRLAGPDAATLTILDADWGRSAATEATDRRLAFLGLMDAIERGEVSTLYAYSTDRLARSVEWSARLLNACERAGVSIVTSEGRFDPNDDAARTLFHFQAITNESYSRQAKRKAQSTADTRRKQGAKLGQPYYGSLPGENLEAVIATFQRIGSYHGTAAALNAAPELAKPRRAERWGHQSVRRILEREGLASAVGTRGAKVRAPHRFYRLLRCHCGRILTASLRAPDAAGRRLTIYRCLAAETTSDHAHKSVAEAIVLRWAQDQVDEHFRPPDTVRMARESRRDRERLTAKRERIIDMAADGAIGKAERDRRLSDVDDALAKLDDAEAIVTMPKIDWTWAPETLNGALRILWTEVRMDADMRPAAVVPRVPEWWTGS